MAIPSRRSPWPQHSARTRGYVYFVIIIGGYHFDQVLTTTADKLEKVREMSQEHV